MARVQSIRVQTEATLLQVFREIMLNFCRQFVIRRYYTKLARFAINLSSYSCADLAWVFVAKLSSTLTKMKSYKHYCERFLEYVESLEMVSKAEIIMLQRLEGVWYTLEKSNKTPHEDQCLLSVF